MKLFAFISVLLSLSGWLQSVKCEHLFVRPMVKGPASNTTVILPDRYFTQKLDHFANRTPEWQQRYLVNDGYFNGTGPIFLYIEGENALDQYWLLEKSIVDYYGKRYGALIVGLEHRFYGKSRPTYDNTKANLQYLTSKQALADIIAFQDVIKSQFNLTRANKWVSFGGSYAGALSAWLRQNYPKNFYAAYASSATILAKDDYYEFYEIVSEALKANSPSCLNNTYAAISQIKALTTSNSGLATLTQLFQSCTPLSSQQIDIKNFFLLMGLNLGLVVQNSDNQAFETQDYCNIINDATLGDPATRYSIFIQSQSGSSCRSYTYEGYYNFVKQVLWTDPAVLSSTKQYLWQQCNEFGFMATSTSRATPFYGTNPVEFLNKLCFDIFGIKSKSVMENAEATNKKYGGTRNYKGTRVIFTNGSLDPWHKLSVKRAPPKCFAISINGASHCADFLLPGPWTSPALKEAQKTIQKQLDRWLKPI